METLTSRSQWRVFARFFSAFVKQPRMIGSIIPTGPAVIRQMLDHVDWDACRTFVEYGPGTGNFTAEILKRLRPDAQLIAIDTNAAFIAHLRNDLTDPRLHPVHGSAVDVGDAVRRHGAQAADYVLSGLPFSTLPPGIKPRIVEATRDILAPGGLFMVYQYSRYVLPELRRCFATVEEDLHWRNVPPCRSFYARKASGQGRSL